MAPPRGAASPPGKLLSQRQLLAEVWGPGCETAGGNLRLYVAQLRRKLEVIRPGRSTWSPNPAWATASSPSPAKSRLVPPDRS